MRIALLKQVGHPSLFIRFSKEERRSTSLARFINEPLVGLAANSYQELAMESSAERVIYAYIAVCSLGTAVHSMKSIHRALNGMPGCHPVDRANSSLYDSGVPTWVSRMQENCYYTSRTSKQYSENMRYVAICFIDGVENTRSLRRETHIAYCVVKDACLGSQSFSFLIVQSRHLFPSLRGMCRSCGTRNRADVARSRFNFTLELHRLRRSSNCRRHRGLGRVM